MRITRAGDGLSTALEIAPAEYHPGQTLHVLLEVEVGRISYEPIRDTDALRRVHTLVAGIGTIVDGKWVRDAVAKQKRLNLEAVGVSELPLDGDGQ
jgi:hypothetical protein